MPDRSSPSALRKRRVSSSTTSEVPSLCVARTLASSVIAHRPARRGDHVVRELELDLLAAAHLDRGASLRNCGSASSRPGTQMKACAVMVGSSGWLTVNGMMRRRSSTSTRIVPSGFTAAPRPYPATSADAKARHRRRRGRRSEHRHVDAFLPRMSLSPSTVSAASGRASGASSRASILRKSARLAELLVLDS